MLQRQETLFPYVAGKAIIAVGRPRVKSMFTLKCFTIYHEVKIVWEILGKWAIILSNRCDFVASQVTIHRHLLLIAAGFR